jgi:hypothetical protein
VMSWDLLSVGQLVSLLVKQLAALIVLVIIVEEVVRLIPLKKEKNLVLKSCKKYVEFEFFEFHLISTCFSCMSLVQSGPHTYYL